MKLTEADIRSFAEFARERAAQGEANLGITELAFQWEATREREQVNDAIASSLADIEAGRTEPFFDSQDKLRRERNLPPRQ